jgi:WD40 repeat protein
LRLRAVKWVRRRPVHAAALVLAGMLASGLIGGVFYRDALLEGHARQLEREVVRADAHARRARRHLQAFQLRQAQQAIEARQVERAQDILAAIEADRERSDAAEDPGDPGFAWHYLMRLARRDLAVLSDRQTERVSTIALSPDGRTLATGDDDGTIRLRDPETGRVRMTLAGHRLLVSRLAFSPDGRRLASVGSRGRQPPLRGEALLWEIDSGRRLAALDGFSDRDVHQVAFDARGERLWEVSSTGDGRSRLGCWDVGTDPAHPRLMWSRFTEETGRPRAGDGPIAALEGTGPGFRLHDLAEAMGLGWTGAIDRNPFAASSPDGRLLAVGVEPRIALWDVRAGRERARFELSPQEAFLAIRFSPDARYLMVLFVSGRCDICDLQTDTIRMIPPAVVEPRPFVGCAFSPDGRFLALNDSRLGGPEPTRICQLDPWREVASYPGVPGGSELLFGPDRRWLILRNDWAAIRWNYAMAREPDQPAGHADEAWSAAFSPDGSILATGSDDDERQSIKLWDVATGRPIRGWKGGPGTTAGVAFAPGGQMLASAHLGKPGEVNLWDPATGHLLGTLAGHTDSVRTVAFSPDGRTLASAGSDRTIRLWDVAARRYTRVLNGHTHAVRRVAFSPDGTLLASAGNDFTVRLWDARSGSLLRTVSGVANYAAVEFAPDGTSLATADERGMISVWDVASGDRLQSVAAELDFPLCLCYSPDGRSLAVAGKGRTIRLWDPVTGQELLTLDGHKGQVNGLSFSPDGSTLASCSHDGAVRLWRAGP